MPEEYEGLQIDLANRNWYKPQLTQEDHVLSNGRVSEIVGNSLVMNKIPKSKSLCRHVWSSASRSTVSYSANCSEQCLQTRATYTTKHVLH